MAKKKEEVQDLKKVQWRGIGMTQVGESTNPFMDGVLCIEDTKSGSVPIPVVFIPRNEIE